MKLTDLFEAYKNQYAAMAAENRARAKKQREEERAAEKARKDAAKGASKDAKAKLENHLYAKAMDAVGQSFPDGDPMEMILPWMNRNNLTIKDLDRVFKKHDGVTFHKYLAVMWDQYAGQAVFDAEHGHVDHNSAFYTVKKGEDKTRFERLPNPWK